MLPDSRVVRIIRWLLDQRGPRSTADLAADLGLTQRVVRYRLGAAEAFLREHGISLTRQPGSGVWIEATPDQRACLQTELTVMEPTPRVYARDERDHVLVSNLLWSAPDITSLDLLQGVLEVSKTSARRDLRRNELWLERRGLMLARRPGVGLAVVGTETKLRRALVQLTVEAVPEEVLTELCLRSFEEAELVHVRVPAGMREHLARLPIRTSAELMFHELFGDMLNEGNSELVFCIYIAVTAARLADGHVVTMETGQLRSLADHPVSSTAEEVATWFDQAFGVRLDDLEVAAITEYLLGLSTLSSRETSEGTGHGVLLDAMVRISAERLHPALELDAELRRSLLQHLDRLSVRLRYGLPVHNPLLAEVADRYPDVHAVARDIGELVAEHFEVGLVEDEVGFITMYLSGAMERGGLRPAKRAIVVCPSGMATAWVLVSRIQAEFPQLELTSVMSARAFRNVIGASADLVISTVELEPTGLPVVVVSPLLTAGDIRRVALHV